MSLGLTMEVDPKFDVVPEEEKQLAQLQTSRTDLGLVQKEVDAQPPEVRAEIDQLKTEIDINNTVEIDQFGGRAQEQNDTVSKKALAGARNRDLGPIGEDIAMMVAQVKGFNITEIGKQKA